MSDDSARTLRFRCPAGLEGRIPPPAPAAQGLPDWLRAMPAHLVSEFAGGEDDTVKRCPPFVDAMTSGFLIPLICDVEVADGRFTWDLDLPAGGSSAWPRSPLSFHHPDAVAGTPLHDPDRFVVKFHNLWTIEAPEGYALLFTHPANRFDLPFTTLTGMVDCDRYTDAWINFPAHWRDPDFRGVLPRGTPVAQCVPVRRERWRAEIGVMGEAEAVAAQALTADIRRERGVYRKRFRA
ncbi:hypothetical protein [Phenylobacterium sp.]|uniref:hypothetical protein n=1 Tax=Phenylobacterium sp. TaxID=1871053 RepID=UPI0025D02EC2|nr:hypothetical protein [Phenylobacterium sp.]MBX3484194.1 hypothetical protein [Phenylobacterium sp.]